MKNHSPLEMEAEGALMATTEKSSMVATVEDMTEVDI